MKIKEVSEHTGLSQKAIRLYEEKEFLQRLQKAGFLEYSNGVYICRHSDFMLYENVFSENDLMEMLQMMQGGGAHRFFFHSSAPMSVGSWSPGPK